MPGDGPLDQLGGLEKIVKSLLPAVKELTTGFKEAGKSAAGLGTSASAAGKSMAGIHGGTGLIPMNQTVDMMNNAQGGGGRVMGGGTGQVNYGANQGYVPAGNAGGGGVAGGGGTGAFGIGEQGGFTGATGGGLLSNLMNLMMIGPQYMFNRVEGNRALAAGISQDVRSMSLYAGRPSNDILEALGNKMPLMGNANQMAAAGNMAGAYGYGNLMRPEFGSGRFMQGAREMQLLTPGVAAEQIVKERGEFLGNTGGHQKALMLTGGAMSGFTAGGQPKTLVEWAEGVLKWFEGLRPGKDKGKPFSQDEINTQMFPGSNMRAWFQSMDTPPYMIDAFWKYALNMRSGTKSTFEETFNEGKMGNDLALRRLQTATSGAEREMKFMSAGGPGSSWYEQYIKREQADTGFNRIMKTLIDNLMGATSGSFMSDMIAGTPTPIANMMSQMMFSTIPHMISETVSSIPLIGGLLGDPDVGDPGDYGDYGSTSTTGLDQSFGKRLKGMMRANPRLKINSGFREGTTQTRLAKKGVGRVTPHLDKSMHTKGLAADLGPRSEYGWIAQNASRFGLDQASRHGEPWHVGPPGTIGDPGKGCCVGCGGAGVSIGDPAMGMMMSSFGDIGDANSKMGAGMENTPCGQAVMQIWPKELWPWAFAVIQRESGGDPNAKNKNSSATGCFQMMMSIHAHRFNGKPGTDPIANAAAALELFKEQGAKPWAASNSNSAAMMALLPPNAQDIAKRGGGGGGGLSGVIDAGKSILGGVGSAIGGAVSGATGFLKSIAGGPFDVFKDLALGFASGDFTSMFDFDVMGKIVKMMNSMTAGMGFSPGGGAMATSAGFANMLADKIGGASGLSGIFGGSGGFWGGDPVGDPAVSMGGAVSPAQMSSYANSGGGGANVSLQGGNVVMHNNFNISGASAQDASRTAQVVASHLNSMMNDRNRRAS
jgi:hypothetical protein